MAIKEIIKMGHPLLLEKAKPVTEFDTLELHKLIEDMIETMADARSLHAALRPLLVLGTEAMEACPGSLA